MVEYSIDYFNERTQEAQRIAELVDSSFSSDNQIVCMSEEFRIKYGISWLLCI